MYLKRHTLGKCSLSIIYIYNLRKFRSQTSDNLDRWKAELGRGREKRRVEERRSEKRKSQKKADADAQKGRKSRNTVFFQWFVAPEGRKVGSLKRRVRSQLARWEMKNCTPLWREAHFEVKMYKTPQCRTTFGSWDVEKGTPLWREAHFEVKMYEAHTFGPLLEVQMSFRVAGARDCAPLQKWAKREGFVACPKTTAGMGHVKRICKDT